MKILELLRQLDNRFPTVSDKERMVENLFRKRDDLHICDLDLALVFIAITIQFKNIDARLYFSEREELIEALIDSSYAKYFAPELFQSDVITVDEQKRQSEVRETVVESLSNGRIARGGLEAINEHELLTEIDIKLLDHTKSKSINASENLKIELRSNNVYSFALSQTKFKIISDIILTNLSDKPLKNGKLIISSDPEFVEISEINIPLINSNQSIAVTEFDVKPKLEKLLGLHEKVIGILTIKYILDEEELVSISSDINYFSYDTWLENAMSGSTALFVTPNETSVKNVCALTAKELQTLTGSPSLSDYQTGDKKNVIQQLKALYNALHKEAIAYITIPPSYESVGQKIRIPHDVLVYKQGTCLDLSILFVSCAENLGLNSFLVRTHGHAFVGVFLEDDNFPTMIYNDGPRSLEMNSEEENEIVFIECTTFTADSPTSFEEACSRGRDNVNTAISTDNVFEIIDIKRARAQGFLPLPINFNDVERAVVDYDVVEQNKVRLARKDYSYKGDKIQLSQAELDKFDVWEKKLLDISRRNQLVNYKPTGKGLQLNFYDMNALYRTFESKKGNYRINFVGSTDSPAFELPTLTEEQYNQIESDFGSGNIGLILRSSGQYSSLKFFERERRKSFEETGSNRFYLALGFIQYFENPKSVNPCYAPVILLPIDLIRNSKDNYSISGREEPPFLNISIFEFFSQEYGLNCDDLLTQISFDSEEVDIDAVLNTVSEKIKKLNRTSIIRTAAINIFNFSKAVMWSDVKFRKPELSKNKIIKSIIDGRFVCEEDELIDNAFDDDNSNPEDLAMPLPADSSQIIAIKDCTDGKSFILQGPPGTGKSQTITNMIVNAIYHGKTVLFVAEKMAALEVVQKRLNQLCLGKFALEAHSIKSDKTSLMEQFEQRIALGSTTSSKEDYLELASKLKIEKKELNRVINLLHKENGYFLSFYDAFVNYLDIDEKVESIVFSDDYVKNLEFSEFQEAARVCEKLNREIISNGGYVSNPFILYRNTNYIPGSSKTKLSNYTALFKKPLIDLINVFKNFNSENGLKFDAKEEVVAPLIDFLLDEQDVINCIKTLIGIDLNSLDQYVMDILDIGKKYQRNIETLKVDFSNQIHDIDYESDSLTYNSLNDAFIIKKIIGRKKLLKKITSLARNPKKYKAKDLPAIYKALEDVNLQEKYLSEQMQKYQVVFGSPSTYKVKDYDFDKFENIYLITKKVIDKYSKHFSFSELSELIFKTQSFSFRGKESLITSYNTFKSVEETFTKELGFDFSLCSKFDIDYETLLSLSNGWMEKIDYLPNWCSLLTTINEAKSHSLFPIIDFIENNETNFDLILIYKKAIFAHIMSKTISGDESGSFNSVELKHHIDFYKELIERFKELTIKETAAIISSKMPSINSKSPSSSQQGILNKAIKSRCRGKSIRQLFAEVPDILTRIFPIFLMSPISCAQYLSPDMPEFDIVIFDEASQMPTSEAIGAIARGKSLIVVGDSKQLPPTAFFQSKGSDDLDSDLDDQESILDDCDVIGMPSRYLNWHYRSKHESLIRFSNAKFYGNKLVTFPSPNDMVTRINFVNTKGIYGGKKATNETEAKAIIKEVERRLKSPELRKRSIGIVTFSSVQQEMVEDLMQDFFAKHKDLEKANLESKEPIIIKNLENIQGDERDVILFSVCYGPDKADNMHYRFGPINNAGGEKRLNVAISRARYEMIVYASFEPERLAAMKTESRGAQELYNFLKYAKYGSNALIVPNGSAIETKIGFEKQLADDLKDRGYKVNINVGQSSFRVDIGVINPNNQNEYILGVLCDSYSYESALTSKDRNIVQPNALDLLGWNLIRVWSFDYLDNSKKVVDEICRLIEDIKLNPENYKNSIIDNPQMEIEFGTKEVEQINYSKPYNCFAKVHAVYGDIYAEQQIIKEIMELEAPISEEVLRNRFANALGFARAGSNIQKDMHHYLKKIGAKRNSNHERTKIFYWNNDQTTDLQFYRVGGSKPRALDDVPKEELIVAIKEVLLNYGPMFSEEVKRYVAKAFGINAVGNKVYKAIEDCTAHYLEKGVLILVDDKSRIALKSQAGSGQSIKNRPKIL